MSIVDHLFFIVLVLVHPVVGYLSYQRLLRRIHAGENVSRSKLYLNTISGHWVLFVAAILIWSLQDRDWAVLGFGPASGTWFLVAAGLTVIAIAMLLIQLRQAANASDEEVIRFRQQIGNVDFILPRNGNELARFYGLSVTAGIVEEVLWRGFIIWYCSQFLPLWAAAVFSAAGFGVAHAYQGFRNVPKIVAVGAVFVGIYLLSGSLWLPMILHAAVDIIQGRLAYDVVRRTGDVGGSPSADDDGSTATNAS